MSKLDAERKRLDIALKGTRYSSKTDGLWRYYRKGIDPVLLTYIEIAKKEGVPIDFQKAFAVYYMNQKINGTRLPKYSRTKKSTLKDWKKAVDIIEKIGRYQ